MRRLIMEMTPRWPTMFGQGKFEVEGLFEYLFANYDLNDPGGDVDGANIFTDNSEMMNKFKSVVHGKFNEYLTNTISKTIEDFGDHEIKAWITGHGKGYSMTTHNHSGAHISAVFYVLAEDKYSGGSIVFIDPRSNANRGYDSSFDDLFAHHAFVPETGDYVIFPSFNYHHVKPYYSEFRICIPVDLYLYSNKDV
ncbi:MAG TPA: hypothetical protein DCW83_14225 [Saprospirales bacterium]|nr:hypothetical protein [Saprospirales bacterium]